MEESRQVKSVHIYQAAQKGVKKSKLNHSTLRPTKA
jgi:hypothetical protein